MSEQTPKDRFGNPLALDDTVVVLGPEDDANDPHDWCDMRGQIAVIKQVKHLPKGVEILIENAHVMGWVSARDVLKPQMPLNHANRNENPHPSSHA